MIFKLNALFVCVCVFRNLYGPVFSHPYFAEISVTSPGQIYVNHLCLGVFAQIIT